MGDIIPNLRLDRLVVERNMEPQPGVGMRDCHPSPTMISLCTQLRICGYQKLREYRFVRGGAGNIRKFRQFDSSKEAGQESPRPADSLFAAIRTKLACLTMML